MYQDQNVAFALHIKLYRDDKRQVVIRAFDDSSWDEAGRVKLEIEVKHGRKVIFPRGQLYCALHGSSNSDEAKELVMSTVAMRPGDTDEEYFADYTPEQLAWASEHGEEIRSEAQARYCDPETGEVRKKKK